MNAYEGKAGMVYLQVKLCDPCLSALRYIQYIKGAIWIRFLSFFLFSFFHSPLITYLFHKYYPRSFTSSFWTAFTDYCLDRFFWATWFMFLFFVSVLWARLSWPSRQLLRARKYTVSCCMQTFSRCLQVVIVTVETWNKMIRINQIRLC